MITLYKKDITNQNNRKYKIIEKRGLFIVYINSIYKVRKLFKPMVKVEEWDVAFKALYSPAHFKDIEEAKQWIYLQSKPDIDHGTFPIK